LSPDEVQANADASAPSHQNEPGKRKWGLTQQAFDNLLNSFSSDRDEAGKLYWKLHQKLVRYFEWRNIDFPEDRADETMNRVARRLEEGEKILTLTSYVYGVARHVYEEALREKKPEPLDEVPPQLLERLLTTEETDPRWLCFDRCVEGLATESRYLILGYYQEERRTKIQLRQQLANNLHIPLNALRIRVHRIRVSLEECIKKCLGAKTVRNQ